MVIFLFSQKIHEKYLLLPFFLTQHDIFLSFLTLKNNLKCLNTDRLKFMWKKKCSFFEQEKTPYFQGVFVLNFCTGEENLTIFSWGTLWIHYFESLSIKIGLKFVMFCWFFFCEIICELWPKICQNQKKILNYHFIKRKVTQKKKWDKFDE